jgi:IS66 Orf2 like protein
LWYRRLEKGKFVFPKNQEGKIEMTPEHFQWLLASDKFSRLEVKDSTNLFVHWRIGWVGGFA